MLVVCSRRARRGKEAPSVAMHGEIAATWSLHAGRARQLYKRRSWPVCKGGQLIEGATNSEVAIGQSCRGSRRREATPRGRPMQRREEGTTSRKRVDGLEPAMQ
ncbi:hypothetical protein GOP47_0001430 [Adiantum capillus-veneris]|uniref:Uncharacterized protein n=1 Tax=Adiantum capillus-veneris TaxID=13818 RepID=A0A9D4VA21_ADICA|nr:hypothetical protein GOP47_0001430 [Adiantum capillus-veneris]